MRNYSAMEIWVASESLNTERTLWQILAKRIMPMLLRWLYVTKMQNGLYLDLFPSVVSQWPCNSFLCQASCRNDLQGLSTNRINE